MSNFLQVFEHSTLAVGGAFKETHFARLVQYNERHGNQFFTVGLNRIHFRNYVGVIQVGNLTVEILPKADRNADSPDEKRKWQGALIDMIRQSGFVRLSTLSDARLRLRSSSLLDIFFESFLAEVHTLLHQGLVRKYRHTTGNLTTLKGRILFPQHIARNLVHRERFFTEHQFYDRNNPFNQILRVALDVITRIGVNPHLSTFARGLSLSFQDIDAACVTERTFMRLSYSRNTERYRRAIQLARLIILNFSPDMRSGREDVLAILFDMNVLFERYIISQLKRAAMRMPGIPIAFKAQASRRYWATDKIQKYIRPDIIAEIGTGEQCERVVLDTKWKMPRDGKPSDSDLHQMHVYNSQFGTERSYLIYPQYAQLQNIRGRFACSQAPHFMHEHTCEMIFADLFQDGHLRNNLGETLIRQIFSTPNMSVPSDAKCLN